MSGAAYWGDAAPMVLWLIVVAADALLAGLPVFRTLLDWPLAFVRALGLWFDRRLNRARRSEASRRVRGVIVTLFVAALAWFAGDALGDLARALPHGWLGEAAAILFLVDQRRPINGARRAAAALQGGRIDAARSALVGLVRYDTATLDTHGVARAAVEACAARLTEGLVGAAFWYFLLGLPGLFAARAVNALAFAIGRQAPSQASFGFAVRRLDDALTLLPGLIAGALFVFASIFCASANPLAALRAWRVDARARFGAAAGRAEGAMAGALGLSLGGPRPYAGDGLVPGAWVGDGRARTTVADVRRAVLLATIAALILATLIASTLAGRLG